MGGATGSFGRPKKKSTPGSKTRVKSRPKVSEIQKKSEGVIAEGQAKRMEISARAEEKFLKESMEGLIPDIPASERLDQIEDELRMKAKKKVPGSKKKK